MDFSFPLVHADPRGPGLHLYSCDCYLGSFILPEHWKFRVRFELT